MNTAGIILDGDLKVGTFDDVCTTVGSRMRELKNVRLMGEYVDVSRGQTTRDLLYLYVVKSGSNTLSILDCVGLGKVYGSMWCDGSYVKWANANFLKTTHGDENAN